MNGICTFCRQRFEDVDHVASILRDHVKTCPAHPLRAAEQRITALRECLQSIQAMAEHDINAGHLAGASTMQIEADARAALALPAY